MKIATNLLLLSIANASFTACSSVTIAVWALYTRSAVRSLKYSTQCCSILSLPYMNAKPFLLPFLSSPREKHKEREKSRPANGGWAEIGQSNEVDLLSLSLSSVAPPTFAAEAPSNQETKKVHRLREKVAVQLEETRHGMA